MKTCENCLNWKETLYGFGKCSEIGEKLTIELITGWDGGVVDFIETEKDFGCILFKLHEK